MWVHTYAYLFCYQMSYAIGSQHFFFHVMHLKVLPYLYTIFFFNNGIIFHPKEASCFIYPSATAGRLGVTSNFGVTRRTSKPPAPAIMDTSSLIPHLSTHTYSEDGFLFSNCPAHGAFYGFPLQNDPELTGLGASPALSPWVASHLDPKPARRPRPRKPLCVLQSGNVLQPHV